MAPKPPASATAEPDMPAKMMLATTLAWPRPPGIQPTSSLAVSKIFSVILPAFIRLPARMNRGTAISRKESMPLTIFWPMTTKGYPRDRHPSTAEAPMEMLIGTPMTRRSTNAIRKITISVSLPYTCARLPRAFSATCSAICRRDSSAI